VQGIIKGLVNADVIDELLKKLKKHAEDKQITE